MSKEIVCIKCIRTEYRIENLQALAYRILAEGWKTSEIADHKDFHFIQELAIEAIKEDKKYEQD